MLPNPLSNLKTSERTLFALAPLPLQSVKTGIQQVVVPLLTTVAASHIPGVGSAIDMAVHEGGHLLSEGAQQAVQSGLDSLGHQVMSNLHNGLGVQSSASALGNAISPVITGAVSGIAKGIGQVGSGIMIGGTAINAVGLARDHLIARGQQTIGDVIARGQQSIGDVIAWSQRAIARTQVFLSQMSQKVQSIIEGARTMAQSNEPTKDNVFQKLRDFVSQPETSAEPVASNLESNGLPLPELAPEPPEVQTTSTVEEAVASNGKSHSEPTPEASEVQATRTVEESEPVVVELTTSRQQEIAAESREPVVEPEASVLTPESHSEPPQAIEPSGQREFETPTEIFAPEVTEPQEFTPIEPTYFQELESPANPSESFTPEALEGVEFTPVEAHSIDEPANQTGLELAQRLSQAGVDVSRFGINADGNSVFKLHNGVPERAQLTSEVSEQINQALNDPASFEGSIRITQGSKVLLHVENGVVKSDMLRLTQQAAKVEIESPTQALYEKASQGIGDHSVKNMKQIAAKAIELGASPKDAMAMLRSHNPAYQGISDTKGKVAAERIAAQAVSGGLALAQSSVTPQSRQQTAELTR